MSHAQTMMENLPPYYAMIRETQHMVQTEGLEFDSLAGAVDSALNQYFVSTATWNLDIWENELGLSPAQNQPVSQRRDRIVSRLRGTGTATVSIVKQVAESYDKGAIDVIEDIPAYTVTIEFVDTRGIPPNLSDLKDAVRAVVPAHLRLQYEFRYTIYEELDGYTYGDIATSGLTYGDLKINIPT